MSPVCYLIGIYCFSSQIDESFKERYQKCGDTYKVTVCMGDKHFTNSWELDKESEFEGKIISYHFVCSFCLDYTQKVKLISYLIKYSTYRCYHAYNQNWSRQIQGH